VTVNYVLNKRIETRIAVSRITVTMMPYKDLTTASRNASRHLLEISFFVL